MTGPANRAAYATDGRQYLFVYPILPAHVRQVSEQPYMVDHGSGPTATFRRHTNALHDITGIVLAQTGEQRSQPVSIRFIEPVIRIQPEDPCAGRPPQAFVAGGGKTVHPGKIKDFCAETGGDFFGAILGTGVDDNDLVNQVGSRCQAVR